MKKPTVAISHEALDKAAFDLQGYMQKKVFAEMRKRLWDTFEHILRNHIDNPIVGELTKEKLKAADIRGLIRDDDEQDMKIDTKSDDKNVIMTIYTNWLGVRQGDMLIQENGNRIPVDEIPCKWYEEHFIYD